MPIIRIAAIAAGYSGGIAAALDPTNHDEPAA
jgi:hypothetical protein